MPAVPPPVWDNIPPELATRQAWLLWKFEAKPGASKPGKIPYYVAGGRRTGGQGTERDLQRLGTLEVARRAYEKGGWSGIGYALLPDDGLIGIDIDGAIDAETGEVSERCQAIIDACASYTEYSPSGRGVHIIVQGTTTINKCNDIGVEMFCGKQFFTFTARRWEGTPASVMPIDEGVLRRLHLTINEAKAQGRDKGKAPAISAAPVPAAQPGASSGDDFHRVNEAAMQALQAWVPSLFPSAIQKGQGYRVTSASLNRQLQEDLSIMPEGIVDFGVADMGDAKQGRRTPVDLVMEHLPAAKPKEALHWLAQRMGIELSQPKARKPKPPRANVPAPAGGGDDAHDDTPPDEDFDDAVHDGVMSQLIKHRGRPMDCRENMLYCLLSDPALQGLVKKNDFTQLIERSRATPWGREAGDWDEEDDLMLGEYVLRTYGLGIKAKTNIRDGVLMAARQNKYNPIVDWIKAETWDGTERLERWITDVYEIEARPYTRLIGKCFMMGLVKRAIQPGCKFDYMMIVKGEQGLAKSGAFRVLAYPYYTDNAIRVGDKDSQMAQQLAWIVESAELESLNKSETTLIKQHLSSQEDWYRPPYGASMVKAPRHSVSVGTTNADTFLKDATGDRRFWPLEVFVVHMDRLQSMRAQLLAEALHRLNAGERYWPTREEEKELIFPEQERFRRADPWEDLLDDYVNCPTKGAKDDPFDEIRANRDFFTTIEIYDRALNIKADRIDGNGQMDTRIGNGMRALGFERHRESSGRRRRGFRRLPPPSPIDTSENAPDGQEIDALPI